MFRWWWSRRYQRHCAHPSYLIRFIHGDERWMGYASQCMACGKLFR